MLIDACHRSVGTYHLALQDRRKLAVECVGNGGRDARLVRRKVLLHGGKEGERHPAAWTAEHVAGRARHAPKLWSAMHRKMTPASSRTKWKKCWSYAYVSCDSCGVWARRCCTCKRAFCGMRSRMFCVTVEKLPARLRRRSRAVPPHRCSR